MHHLLMEEKNKKPKLINKIQDRRGKTIYNSFSDKCVSCDRFSADSNELPFIQSTEKQVLSKETAYQITSILEGVVKRGTGKTKKSKCSSGWKNRDHK